MSAPVDLDPFELPEWLGEAEVCWRAEAGLEGACRVRGRLTGSGPDVTCDLLAVDEACPQPVADDRLRATAHQAWRRGQVAVAAYDDRPTLLVPGTSFTPERVIDAVGRLAKAVGAPPDRYTVLLRLG